MKTRQAKTITNMDNSFLKSIAFIAILGGCAAWMGEPRDKGDLNTAIQNAVSNFLQSTNKNTGDNIFFITAKSITPDLYGVSFEATNDKVVVITEDRITFDYRALPSGYIDRNGKLFYWRDSTANKHANEEMIATLKKYNLLDTAVVGAIIPESTIAHHKKGVDYYFCKDNISKFKRVRTSRAMGHYPPPNVSCN